jgi:hypothetical protein
MIKQKDNKAKYVFCYKTVAFGVTAVGFVVIFPMLIERYNFFSLRRFFQHSDEEGM